MPELVARAKVNSTLAVRPESVSLLLSLSGFSPGTTILTSLVFRPRRIVVISSGDAVASFETICRSLHNDVRWNDDAVELIECDPDDARSVARIVDQLVPGAEEAEGTLIDITGGKKIMTAAAALAAWHRDLPMSYVDGEYDKELRQPVPGTERIVMIDRPSVLFTASGSA